ncbi:MAG: hypothetical protein KDA84_08715 [Planctomycetaceae bacterium]|nr:hypothetical protein [Planctomycetaceae bacterium]
MPESSYQPGFRFSLVDGIVITVGTIASCVLASVDWRIAFVIAFVVMHFFLFCNIFRVSRSLELVWSAVFIGLSYSTISFEKPSWPITVSAVLCLTMIVIGIEMRKPSYHGILWRIINPKMPEWWEARNRDPNTTQRSIPGDG